MALERRSEKGLEAPLFDVFEDFIGSADAGTNRAFHEALPPVERVGVFAGELQEVRRLAFESGEGGELAGEIAGVGSARRGLIQPVRELHDVFSAGVRRRSLCSRIDLVEIREKGVRV